MLGDVQVPGLDRVRKGEVQSGEDCLVDQGELFLGVVLTHLVGVFWEFK